MTFSHASIGVLLLFASLTACQNGETNTPKEPQLSAQTEAQAPLTTIQWIDSVKQVGKITEGQKLVLNYRFKNTGANPLIIASVSPGCGCTVADKPEKPIMPGEEGVITGEFDSNKRLGPLHKTILVTANTEGKTNHTLVFEGEVVGK